MSKNKTIILVHGFWGGAAHWAKVIPELERKGYHNIRAVELPLTSLANDVERLQKMIKQQQNDVILVGHSYGGAVITEAGNLSNVSGLIYIAAFAPDTGESPGKITEKNPPAAFSSISPDSDGYLWIDYDKYHESFCQDLNVEDAWVMSVTQKAPLESTFSNTISTPAWKNKPCWYQISSQDRMINPANQKYMAERMNPQKVITLDASHASLASQPLAIAEFIIDAIETDI
ncbi:alpha/beta hydrolase [Acinetobacter stercoris]|uniref:Pyrethroid hydrolase n=1 Tax=Acinetobacter stercoris TaxID=2126983 RepID=A0A2U3N342_9GAMM|nr:alpha/beta hydrolase [Acinetobacter stercoris]SPL72106.1 Pyrethroid hydrolase [Acinetobacter stercoris]